MSRKEGTKTHCASIWWFDGISKGYSFVIQKILRLVKLIPKGHKVFAKHNTAYTYILAFFVPYIILPYDYFSSLPQQALATTL